MKIIKKSLIIVIALVSLFSVWFVARPQKAVAPSENPNFSGKKTCTREAKRCSNGSYVDRSGPDCEFEKCD